MIRTVRREDLPECVYVIRTSFQTVADEFGFTVENAPRFTAFATTPERLAWQMYSEHRLMYLDEEEGRICGYYSLLLLDNGECELGNLSVLPEFRHRGIGGRLLLHAMETAEEQHCTVMNLSIVEENTVLRKWYERYGAVHTGTKVFDFFPFTCGYMKILTGTEKQLQADETIRLFTASACEILGENLVGVYLHGSAAMDCFNPAKSDLDLIVVVQNAPDDAVKRAFTDRISELHARAAGKEANHSGIEMSMVLRKACNPFVYPTPFELHFSAMHAEWYRRDAEDYIRKMKGTDKDLAAHFTVIRHRGKCLYGEPIADVFGPVPAEDYLDSIRDDIAGAREEIGGNTMYLTLNLARVLAYRTEGSVLSKREGGIWGLSHLPEKYHPLLRDALRDYESDAEVPYKLKLAEDYAAFMLDRIAEDNSRMDVCGKTYRIIRLLGHGKGGYSYLAERDGRKAVLKQIHHEPCDYYTFGNKTEAEHRDYERLKHAGIRIPEMLAIDEKTERILKEYIAGETIFDLVRSGRSAEPYLSQVREMAAQAAEAGLNIDYFPTNFVIRDGLIWYIDYECNEYSDEWNFENWGIRYWSRTPEFETYLKTHDG